MFWTILIACVLAVLAGGTAFWLVATLKITPTALLIAGPLAMAVIPPNIAAGLVSGAWLGEAFSIRAREGITAPNERLGWRRVVWDALGVNLAFLVGLVYIFRQRATETPIAVLIAGLVLLLGLILCYFQATAWDIPRQLRVAHGYLVGLAAFLPWAFFLARLGWTFLGLGFLTFLFLPPFFLATLGLKLTLPPPRRRRRLRRTQVSIKMPYR